MRHLLIILLFCVACESATKNNLTETIPLTVIDLQNQLSSNDKFTFQSICSEISLIPIDSSITRLAMVDKVLHTGNMFFIFDDNLNNIYLLSTSGRLVRKIGKKGLGPQEYSNLIDVQWDAANQRLLALDIDKRLIHQYDTLGNHLGVVKLNHQAYRFTISNNLIATFSGYFDDEGINLRVLKDEGTIISKSFPFPANKSLMKFKFTGNITNGLAGILYSESTSSIIYQSDNNSNFIPRFKVDFGLNTWPESSIYEHDSFLEQIQIGDVDFLRSYYAENENYFVFEYNDSNLTSGSGTNNPKLAIFSKKDSKIYGSKTFENDPFYSLVNGPRGNSVNREYFISTITHDNFKRFDKFLNADDKKAFELRKWFGVRNEQNPLLILYSLK